MTVLVAEDDPVAGLLLQSSLRKAGHEVIAVGDGEEAWQRLEQGGVELAVLDWMMPGTDGVELCRRLRRERPDPYVYVILVTARSDADDVVAGLEAGADDYVAKPVHPAELGARVRAGQRIVRLERALRAAYQQAREDSLTDPLTGLLSRRGIEDLLTREIRRAGRYGHWLTVAMADVDHFKAINDTYGHLVGDQVLRQVAEALVRHLRQGVDVVARYGGEEFVIVLCETDLAGALVASERLRASVQELPAAGLEGAGPVTISIGVGAHPPQALRPDTQPRDLIAAADAKLYEAKAAGRNRVAA